MTPDLRSSWFGGHLILVKLTLVRLVPFGHSSMQEYSGFCDPVVLILDDEFAGGHVPE